VLSERGARKAGTAMNDDSARLEPSRSGTSVHRTAYLWESGLRTEIGRIRTEVRASTFDDRSIPIIEEVRAALLEAEDLLAEIANRRWFQRVGHGGRFYEVALAPILRARQDVLLIAEEGALFAQVPTLKAGVKAYLRAADPRTDDYIRFLDGFLPGPSESRR
jgi:hypothetical protein